MKQVIRTAVRKIILLFILVCVAFFGIILLSAAAPFRFEIAQITNSTDYEDGLNQGASEIIPYIKKVQTKDSYTKLIVGDSVCFRLFSELQELNQEYCIAGTNRGLTMSGQYILVHEFLENHPEATDVYLCVIEDSLLTNYETGYGYQYGVMPFAETRLLSLLDQETLGQMGQTYGSIFIQPKVVDLIENSPMNKKLYYNLLEQINPTYSTYEFPDVSCRYIQKMVLFCEEKNVNFYLVAEPLKDTKERHELEGILRENYKDTVICKYFPCYFDQIQYYDEKRFSDNVHIVGSREEQNDVIRAMQKAGNVMNDLVLE